MGTESRLARILDQILERTRSSEQPWAAGNASATTFDTAVGSFTLTISSEDDDDAAPFRFGLYDKDGQELDFLRTESQRQVDTIDERRATIDRNHRLRDLYTLARRQVLGIDEALDEVSSELGLD